MKKFVDNQTMIDDFI